MKINDKKGEVIPMKKGDKIQNPTPPISMIRLKEVPKPQNYNPLQTKIIQPTLSPKPVVKNFQQFSLSPITQTQLTMDHIIQPNVQTSPVIQTFGLQQPIGLHQTYNYQPFQQSFAQVQPTLNVQPSISPQTYSTHLAQTILQPVQVPVPVPVQQITIQPVPVIEKELRVEYVEQKKNVVRMIEQEIEEVIPVEKIHVDYVPVQTIIEKIPVPVQKPYFIQREIPVPLPRFQQSNNDDFLQYPKIQQQIIRNLIGLKEAKQEKIIQKNEQEGQQLNDTLKQTQRKIPEGLGYETYSPEKRRYIDIESPREIEIRRQIEINRDIINQQQVYFNPYRQIDWNRQRYQYDKDLQYLDYLDRWEQERYQFGFHEYPPYHIRHPYDSPYPPQNLDRYRERI